MIDTFQISRTVARPPNISELLRVGWKAAPYQNSDDPTAFFYNAAKNEGKPRLTLSRNRNFMWNLRAEVSLGSWLYGSNQHLVNERELFEGLNLLSEYVEDLSGIAFDAQTERVSRVDFTRDFQVGENFVIPIIAKFAGLTLPRYQRVCYADESVYFKNSLLKNKLNKQIKIYSKHHETLANSTDSAAQDKAKGILRLEVSYQKSAVNRLAKSFKLPKHHANHILTLKTSENAIAWAMKMLHFEKLATAESSKVEELFEFYDTPAALSRIGYLFMKKNYGDDFPNLPFIKASPKTFKRYEDDCRRAGVLSLE